MLFIPLLFLCFALEAVTWEAGAYIGYRESTTTYEPLTLGAFGGIGPVELSVRFQNDEYTSRYDFSFCYDHNTRRSDHILQAHTAWMPEEGGWTDFSYIYAYRHRWGWFTLSVEAGLGGAFAWSVYSTMLTWAVSPVVGGRMVFHILQYADITLFATLCYPEERDFHFTPVAGGRVDVYLGPCALFFEGYAKSAEYIIDPWFTLNAYAVRIGCSYRGEV